MQKVGEDMEELGVSYLVGKDENSFSTFVKLFGQNLLK